MNSGLKTPELEEEGNEREGTNLFYPTFFFFFFFLTFLALKG